MEGNKDGNKEGNITPHLHSRLTMRTGGPTSHKQTHPMCPHRWGCRRRCQGRPERQRRAFLPARPTLPLPPCTPLGRCRGWQCTTPVLDDGQTGARWRRSQFSVVAGWCGWEARAACLVCSPDPRADPRWQTVPSLCEPRGPACSTAAACLHMCLCVCVRACVRVCLCAFART